MTGVQTCALPISLVPAAGHVLAAEPPPGSAGGVVAQRRDEGDAAAHDQRVDDVRLLRGRLRVTDADWRRCHDARRSDERLEPVHPVDEEFIADVSLARIPHANEYAALRPDGNAFNASRRRFAYEVLRGLDLPVTAPNMVALMAWAVAESG